ncbi:PAS domain-containing sensor histidine kinase [Ferruginibacter sp.]
MENSVVTDLDLSVFFDITPDLVCIASKEGYFKRINQSVVDRLGYSREELFSKPIASFIYTDDKLRTQQYRADLLKGKVLRNFANRYVTKTNDIVWLEWTSIYNPATETVFAIAKDVTERKLVEKEVEENYIKLQGMATHFKKRVEKVKKYFAYELHEELAQLVSVLKMDIDWILNYKTDLPPTVDERVEHASAIAQMLIKSIQRISFSISPGMLDDLGLNATLEWLCNEFSLLNNIPCSFTSSCNETYLTQELKTDLFRVCQGALTNVTFHAQATNVSVSIDEWEDKIRLTIQDDGKGFDVNQRKETPGLTNMRERASSVNGHVQIESAPGAGTKICFTVSSPITNISQS